MVKSSPSRWQMRRTARRMRRYGVQPTMDIAEQADLGAYAFGAIGRWFRRHRSALAPVPVILGLIVAGAILHANLPGWWAVCLLAGAVFAPLVWIFGPRIGLSHPAERVYAFTVVDAASIWLAAAAKAGPLHKPLPAILLVGGVVLSIPWWAHRRRRAKVRVERTLEAWPQIAEAVELAGSRVQSVVVDLWGWTARFALARGQTVEDAIGKQGKIESGIGARRGASRITPTPDNLANRMQMRVLDVDPHAEPISWPGPSMTSINDPVELGIFEDGTPVRVLIKGRHCLIGGATGSGKSSGGVNGLLANLTACPDVIIWGIDLKGGMELQPWAACLDRLATTAADAEALLADAVAYLDMRADRLAREGKREWEPTPDDPALIIIIDEYAELVEEAPGAVKYADSIARRGRAVLVNQIVATQRPTSKTMGKGAIRSQMDVRIAFRVKERGDVDLILVQGAYKAGWSAHKLDKPGKFLISTPEHDRPDRARAYLITDQHVSETAARNAGNRPTLPPLPARSAEKPSETPVTAPAPNHERSDDNAAQALWEALSHAPEDGLTINELEKITGMKRRWIYYQLNTLARTGKVHKVANRRGHWRATAEPHNP